MKKIINGTKYDTDTADLIGSFTAGGVCRRDYRYIHEELYRKKNGEFSCLARVLPVLSMLSLLRVAAITAVKH